MNKAYKAENDIVSYYHLLNNTFSPECDASLGKKNLDAIQKILKTVPVYMLECTNDKQAVYEIKNLLERDGIL